MRSSKEVSEILFDIQARVDSYIHTESDEYMIGKIVMLSNRIEKESDSELETAIEIALIGLYERV